MLLCTASSEIVNVLSLSTEVGGFRIEPSSCFGFSFRDGTSSRKLRMDHQENQPRIYAGRASCFHARDELTNHSGFWGVANAVNGAEVTLTG